MLIWILLLILIITLIQPVYGGSAVKFIHIVPLAESSTQNTLIIGLATLFSLNISHKQRRVLNAYIFANSAENIIRSFAGEPDLTNIKNQEQYYTEFVGPDFNNFIELLRKPVKHGIIVNTTFKNSIGSYKQLKLENRRKFGYNPPLKTDYETRLIYTLVDIVFKGDQWSVISDSEMEYLHKRGFLIECFGSPINTRSKYFGAMLKQDSVYGALGKCQEILHTLINKLDLKHNNTLVYNSSDIPKIMLSPPSGYDLQLEISQLVKQLLYIRAAEVHLGTSNAVHKILDPDLKLFMQTCNNHVDMYEMVNNKMVFRKKLEPEKSWFNCTFSSIEFFNFKKYLQKNINIPVFNNAPQYDLGHGIYIAPNANNIINFSYIFTGQDYIYPEPKPYYGELSAKLAVPDNLPTNPFNKPLLIKKIGDYNLIDDSVLPGGTKQRALYWFIGNKNLIYAGPSSGVAQVAMGIIANHKGLKSYMFSSGNDTELTNRARKYGVNIIHCTDLKNCQEKAKTFNAQNSDTELLPFGLNDPLFTYYLARALIDVKNNINPKRMWLVCGSGVLLRTLYYVFPETYFLGVQVGKTIWPDEIDTSRTRIFVHPQRFTETASELPPYNAVKNYDAKIWYFINKYGKPGDYIWNVAA